MKFNCNLYVNTTNILQSPLKQGKKFSDKKIVKIDTISLKKEICPPQFMRNNESKEKIKKTNNDLKINNKQYLDNFEKIKEISREYNYLAYNDAQLKYEYKSINLIKNTLNKKSSKNLQTKNFISDITKLTKKSKTIFND